MASATWILTGSPENYETTRELGFTLIGMKERRRRMAESMLRTVSEHDARVLTEAMGERARTPA